MKKIRLEIKGLTYASSQQGAYALVLGEEKGKRNLPIIIGAFEAQAIAIVIEGMNPSRPMTHDLFVNLANAFSITLEEVIIFNLVDGIFHAKLICVQNGERREIESRTSDAIAIAVRFNCPIYTYEFILASAAAPDELFANIETKEDKPEKKEKRSPVLTQTELAKSSTDELNEFLKKALEEEAYERASLIRDELKRRKSN